MDNFQANVFPNIKKTIVIFLNEILCHFWFSYSCIHSNIWVDSLVIDCYTVTRMDKWKDENISYMPTDIAYKAIGNFAAKIKGTEIGNFQNPNPAQRKITHTIRIWKALFFITCQHYWEYGSNFTSIQEFSGWR